MTYKWNIVVDGKVVGSDARLKDAKELASYFGKTVAIER